MQITDIQLSIIRTVDSLANRFERRTVSAGHLYVASLKEDTTLCIEENLITIIFLHIYYNYNDAK